MMRHSFSVCYLLLTFFPLATYSLTLQLPSIRNRNSNSNNSNNFCTSSFSKPTPSIFFTRQNQKYHSAPESDFVDVEFERSSPEAEDENSVTDLSSENDDVEDDLSALLGTSKNLIDMSLESGDPRWKEIRIPFTRGTEYIDCKLAFTVDLEGQSYGIGVPFDDVVAIVIQENNDKKSSSEKNFQTKNIDPDAYKDNDEFAELMEIFAVQVQQQLGEEYKLRKTPKVLTISGGLDKITKNWQNKVITKSFNVDELLEISKPKDEDNLSKELNSFYKFMRDELGDEEFEKTINSDDDEDAMEAELNELMGLFDVPGVIGTSEGGREDLEDLMQSIAKDIEAGEVLEANEFIPDTENAALKLLGYTFRESGKSYFLVKPLQSYVMIGRHVEEEKDIIRFELLTPEEDKVVIPKLEQICRDDLEANGLAFPNIED